MFWFRVFERDGTSVSPIGWDGCVVYESEEEATAAAVAYRDRKSNVNHIEIIESSSPSIESCVATVWAEEAEAAEAEEPQDSV